MARPQRNTVDYFPFICQEGKKMFYIEQTYGNDGFATFVKLLRELALSENHYLNLSEPTTMMFLSAKCRVSKEVLEAIINDLVNLGKFDKVLWTENKIIWCADFIENISDAYNKRNNKCITYDGLLLLLISLGIRKPIKSKSEVPVKPHSIVEYTKLDDSIGEESKEEDILFKKETKTQKFVFKSEMIKYGFDSKLVDEWLLIRKNKKATNTQTAFEQFIKEIETRPSNINEILKTIVTNSWSGFKHTWIDNLKNTENGKSGNNQGGNRTPTTDELAEQSYSAVAKLLGRTQ